jgi:choline dehydrogenase-like flavoprotein
MLDEANMAFSRCRKCNCCDGFPCLVHAKSDAEVLGMRPALASPNVSLLTRAEVRRLVTDASGRSVTGGGAAARWRAPSG